MNVETFHVAHLFIKNQCYLLHDGKVGVLIDPAWNVDLINDFLANNKIVLKGVLLTHSHIDHTNLAQTFAQQFEVPVYMSAKEIDEYDFNCTNLLRAEHLQMITLAGFRILPILTPGHTSGSMCYLADEHLFCGDTIFIEGVGVCTDADKMFESVQFLKGFLPRDTLFWPGHSFGQPPGKDLRFIVKNNIYFQFEKREHFVHFRMRKNQPDPFTFD